MPLPQPALWRAEIILALAALALIGLAIAACAAAQTGPRPGGGGSGQGGNPPGRTWDVEQLGGTSRTNPATINPGQPEVSIRLRGDTRAIVANNIPNHRVGRFPNGSVTAQSNTYQLDATPSQRGRATYLRLGSSFGVATNGVTFDPLAAEFYERGGMDWSYVANNGAIPLGLDTQSGHIQGGGEYHYHGIADLMLEAAGYVTGQHSPLIGYAADGFPIYALYGYVDGQGYKGAAQVRSGWVLRSGARPGGANAPGGTYDGTFHGDYIYAGGAGTLDECNGMTTQTPDYPGGTYAYFLTEEYPVVPLCHMGTASSSFRSGRR